MSRRARGRVGDECLRREQAGVFLEPRSSKMTGQADLSLLSCWQQGSDRFISSSVVTCPPHSEQQASMAFIIVAAPRLLPGLKARGYDSSKPRNPAPRVVRAASGKVSYPPSQHEDDLSVRSLPFVLSVLGPIISASVISTQQDDSPMTEGNMADMMAKLAAAEAEAEKLRSELKESAKAPVPTGTIDELAKQKPAKPENRIDGKGGRETLFGTAKNSGDAWLKDGMQFWRATSPVSLVNLWRCQRRIRIPSTAALPLVSSAPESSWA